MANVSSRLGYGRNAARRLDLSQRETVPVWVWAFCAVGLVWSFSEATFWWVAPDISFCVAWVYFPKYWKRFLGSALVGALAGSALTYAWAGADPTGWEQYVLSMRFHSAANIAHVREALHTDPWSIVKGAWQGVPYKIYFGVAAAAGKGFWPLAMLGLVSRCLRFLFALGVSYSVRFVARPWSMRHPFALSCLLSSIWVTLIVVFDVVVNRRMLN